MNGINVVICSLVLIACAISIRLGFEIALVSDGLKSEIIQKYNSGKIVCVELSGELVCREKK